MTKAELEAEIENLKRRAREREEALANHVNARINESRASREKIARMKRERAMLMAYMRQAIEPIEMQLEAIRQLCFDHLQSED